MNQNKPEPCELAEIVFEKPLSGAFEEVFFGSDRENTLWVKFSDRDGAGEWIGKFGVGSWGSGSAIKFAEPDQFMVSAGSVAYLVNATSRKLINQYQYDRAQEIIYDNKRKLFILADNADLHWAEFSGKILFSRRISLDGISSLRIEGSVLSGMAALDYEASDKRFTFDLDELKILDWETIPTKTSRNKKSWWKFW